MAGPAAGAGAAGPADLVDVTGAPEAKVGQKTKCPSCGEKITIPGADSAEDEPDDAPIARTVKAPKTIASVRKPAREPEPEDDEPEPEAKRPGARPGRGGIGATEREAGRGPSGRGGKATGRRRAQPQPDEAAPEEPAAGEEGGPRRTSRRGKTAARGARSGGRSGRRGAVADPDQLDELAAQTWKYGLFCFLFAPYFAPMAIVTGKKAKAAARAGGLPLPGKARNGLLIAWLSVASMALSIVAVIAVIVIAVAAGAAVKKDLDRKSQEMQQEAPDR